MKLPIGSWAFAILMLLWALTGMPKYEDLKIAYSKLVNESGAE